MAEQILDARALVPTSKLQTIVKTATDLKIGESFILQNDRDLQSLKHRFEVEYKGQFEWEYMNEGPDLYKVRITKRENDKLLEEYLTNGILDATKVPMRIKHETIIQTAVNLEAGESFILQNDHDPIPLKYQFDAEHPNEFAWDYIIKGPDIFEITITRKKPAKPENEYMTDGVLNATLIPMRIKHEKIIETAVSLTKGESFILQNDHDPIPLKYQFDAEHPGEFAWDYVKKGPDVFEIKISRIADPAGNEAASSTDKVLDAIALDPSVKFQTIMKTFHELKAGEDFILHNDHDPKPLYYKLTADQGDTFTWDYLKQGPEIFEIRIAKKSQATTSSNKKEEKTLDAICINPSEKLQTILKTFNDLQPGEGFILHNDHDPKPLYYKLTADKGDTFTWEYLKQGPEIYEIRIAKKAISQPTTTVEGTSDLSDHIVFATNTPATLRTITAKDYRKTYVLREHGIDYAWKGNRSIKEVCAETGIEESDLREELQLAEEDFSLSVPSQDYYHWDMAFLADFILATHHKYVRTNAERISALAERVGAHYDSTETRTLAREVRPMIEDFMTHMSKEENVLFPAIKEMLKLMHEGQKNPGPGGAMANAVEKMEAEHDETRQYLAKFRKITNDYQVPDDAPALQKQLYSEMQLFENDTYMHVHLENNILFPKMIILEEKISK